VAKYARSFYDVQQSVFPSLRGDLEGMGLLGASEIGQKEEERKGSHVMRTRWANERREPR